MGDMKRLAQVASYALVVCGAIWITFDRQQHDARGRFNGRGGAADAKTALAVQRSPKSFDNRQAAGILQPKQVVSDRFTLRIEVAP